jgi:rare lipoprotein A
MTLKNPVSKIFEEPEPEDNKSVIITINDRGPHTRGREIDLAKRPFLDISHNNGRSLLRVSLEIVE